MKNLVVVLLVIAISTISFSVVSAETEEVRTGKLTFTSNDPSKVVEELEVMVKGIEESLSVSIEIPEKTVFIKDDCLEKGEGLIVCYVIQKDELSIFILVTESTITKTNKTKIEEKTYLESIDVNTSVY